MRSLPAASLAVATALALTASCGGGDGKKAATTTSGPPPSEETTTSVEPTTTTTAVDPALQALLLVASDLPGFKDQAAASPTTTPPTTTPTTACDATEVPAVKAILDAPTANGATLVKGTNDAVKVSSRALKTTPEQAQSGLTELLDPKAASCLESDLKALVEKEQPAGTTVTLKLTTGQSTVAGSEQTVILSGAATVKADTVSRTLRQDLVFLRTAGTVVAISYGGPSSLATTGERQGVIVTAAAKLTGGSSPSTTSAGGTGSSTSSTRRTSTTRRSTSSTRRSSSTTASTMKASTSTSGSTP